MSTDREYPTRISTARIRLRRVVHDDEKLLVVLNGDEGVMRYLDRLPPSAEQVKEEIRRNVDDYSRCPQLGRWIAESQDGEFMGWFALAPYDDAGRGERGEDPISVLEIGYRLRTRFWGIGLATEGCRSLLRHAFSLPEVVQVVGTTMFVNTASRRVMEKAGMKHVKTFHVEFDDPLPGTELGEVLYSVSRSEWEDNPPK